jgi:hypothetical protein
MTSRTLSTPTSRQRKRDSLPMPHPAEPTEVDDLDAPADATEPESMAAPAPVVPTKSPAGARARLLAELPALDAAIAAAVPARETRLPLLEKWRKTTPAPGCPRIAPSRMSVVPLTDAENIQLVECNRVVDAARAAADRRIVVLRELRTIAPQSILNRLADADRAGIALGRALPQLQLTLPLAYLDRVSTIVADASRESRDLDAALCSASWGELESMQ